jgi:hypothetical protein
MTPCEGDEDLFSTQRHQDTKSLFYMHQINLFPPQRLTPEKKRAVDRFFWCFGVLALNSSA